MTSREQKWSMDGRTGLGTIPVINEEPPQPSGLSAKALRKAFTKTLNGIGEGSFRTRLSMTRKEDKSQMLHAGLMMQKEAGAEYLQHEMSEARKAVTNLDAAVSSAHSFRERSTKLLEEAHRALGRLEQAASYREDRRKGDLIPMACEIKCAVRRGITLVDVYGKYGTMVKLMTLFMRSYIYAKFDKQTERLRGLTPPPEAPRMGGVESPRGGNMETSSAPPLRGATGGGASPAFTVHGRSNLAPSGSSPAGLTTSQGPGPPSGPGTQPQSQASAPAAAQQASPQRGQEQGQAQGPAQPPPRHQGTTSSLPSAGPSGNLGPSSQPPQPVSQALARTSAPHLASMGGQQLLIGPVTSQMVRANTHERIQAITYVPPMHGAMEHHVCIWWSTDKMLEFYSGAMQSTTGFRQDKSNYVTALGVDDRGNVWTGNVKGLISVRPKLQWETVLEERAFGAQVRSIAFDAVGRAWIGDAAGRVKVFAYEQAPGRLSTVAKLQRSAKLVAKMKTSICDAPRGLFGKRANPAAVIGNTAFAIGNAVAAGVAGLREGASGPAGGRMDLIPASMSGDNHAVAGSESQVLVQGAGAAGGTGGAAAVGTGAAAAVGPGATLDGPVRCIFLRGARGWTSGGRNSTWLLLWDANTFQDLDAYDCSSLGACHAMTALRWVSSNPSHDSRNPTTLHFDTGLSTDTTSAAAAAAAAASGRGSAAPTPPGSNSLGWRLLTGHDNGQLLLWDPSLPLLAPLLRIGEPCSPCRGIAAFDVQRIIVTGHFNGEMRIFAQPGADLTLPAPANGVIGTLRPRMATVAAHKSRVDRMAQCPTSCVTSSNLGTIRLWQAADLAAEAQRQGLLTHTTSYSTLMAGIKAGPGGWNKSRREGDLAPSGNESGLGLKQLTASDALSAQPSSQPPMHNSSPNTALSSALSTPVAAMGGAASLPQAHSQPPLPAHGGSMRHNASQPQLSSSTPGMQGAAGAGGRHTRHQSRESLEHTGTGTLTQASSGGTGTVADLAAGAMIPVGSMSQSMSTTSTLAGAVAPAAAPPGFPNFQTIEAAELVFQKAIGSGAYGSVFLADWTGCQVAVKQLHGLQGGIDPNSREYGALVNEVTLLGSLSHPNIMRFLAMCLDPPLIVMQYYPHGSLFDLLSRARRGSAKATRELAWVKRLNMLRDVAAGMHYLHTRKPPVIHGDLRSPNLLLDLTIDHDRPRFHVKIADFGLARMLTNTSVMVSKTTNARWLAPEVIINSAVGKAADVYSFAIIMWEMLTWQQPYEDMMSVQVICSALTGTARPDIPPDPELPGSPGVSLHLYRQLMERCWHADAEQRPSFKEVVEYFQGMQQVEAEHARANPSRSALAGRSRPPSDHGSPAGAATLPVTIGAWGVTGGGTASPHAAVQAATGSVDGGAGGAGSVASGPRPRMRARSDDGSPSPSGTPQHPGVTRIGSSTAGHKWRINTGAGASTSIGGEAGAGQGPSPYAQQGASPFAGQGQGHGQGQGQYPTAPQQLPGAASPFFNQHYAAVGTPFGAAQPTLMSTPFLHPASSNISGGSASGDQSAMAAANASAAASAAMAAIALGLPVPQDHAPPPPPMHPQYGAPLQYGSSRMPYGMSPILEEQLSTGGVGSPGYGNAPSAAGRTSQHQHMHPANVRAQQHAYPHYMPDEQQQQQMQPVPYQQQTPPYQLLPGQQHHSAVHPHVHFAPGSPFAASAAAGGQGYQPTGMSYSVPSSPALGAVNRSRASSRVVPTNSLPGAPAMQYTPIPPAGAPGSGSSADSIAAARAAYAASQQQQQQMQQVYGVGGSGLSSVRVSPASGAGGGGGGGGGGSSTPRRSAAAAQGPGVPRQGSGGSNTPRQGSGSGIPAHVAALATATRATVRRGNSATGGTMAGLAVAAAASASSFTSPNSEGANAMANVQPVWEVYPPPGARGGASPFSPFADTPSDGMAGVSYALPDMGCYGNMPDGDASAQQYYNQAPPAPAASAPVRHSSGANTPTAASRAAHAAGGGATRAGTVRASSVASGGTASPGAHTRRIPGPSFGPGPVLRSSSVTAGSGVNLRGSASSVLGNAGSAPNQPGTPHNRPMPTSGAGARSIGLDGRSSAGRAMGASTATSVGTAMRMHSGATEGPSSGTRTPGVTSRASSVTSQGAYHPMAGAGQAGAGVGPSSGGLAGAHHQHSSYHGYPPPHPHPHPHQHASILQQQHHHQTPGTPQWQHSGHSTPMSHGLPTGGSGHRRTPSGGSITGGSGTPASRMRDVTGQGTPGSGGRTPSATGLHTILTKPRTSATATAAASRSTVSSPRVSASNATAPAAAGGGGGGSGSRPRNIVRRNTSNVGNSSAPGSATAAAAAAPANGPGSSTLGSSPSGSGAYLSRLGLANPSRPPASPRHVGFAPGTTSRGLDCQGSLPLVNSGDRPDPGQPSFSRIPTFSHNVNGGGGIPHTNSGPGAAPAPPNGQPLPTKTPTSTSLDEGTGRHNLAQSPASFSLPSGPSVYTSDRPLAATAPGGTHYPNPNANPSHSPFAMRTWDGMGTQLSPQGTAEELTGSSSLRNPSANDYQHLSHEDLAAAAQPTGGYMVPAGLSATGHGDNSVAGPAAAARQRAAGQRASPSGAPAPHSLFAAATHAYNPFGAVAHLVPHEEEGEGEDEGQGSGHQQQQQQQQQGRGLPHPRAGGVTVEVPEGQGEGGHESDPGLFLDARTSPVAPMAGRSRLAINSIVSDQVTGEALLEYRRQLRTASGGTSASEDTPGQQHAGAPPPPWMVHQQQQQPKRQQNDAGPSPPSGPPGRIANAFNPFAAAAYAPFAEEDEDGGQREQEQERGPGPDPPSGPPGRMPMASNPFAAAANSPFGEEEEQEQQQKRRTEDVDAGPSPPVGKPGRIAMAFNPFAAAANAPFGAEDE